MFPILSHLQEGRVFKLAQMCYVIIKPVIVVSKMNASAKIAGTRGMYNVKMSFKQYPY